MAEGKIGLKGFEVMGGRAADWYDVAQICQWLNEEENFEYALHGGFALMNWGSPFQTADIDITMRPTVENFEHIRNALIKLPGGKMSVADPEQMVNLPIVRLVDDVKVDIMTHVSAIDFDYLELIPQVINGVTIPMVSGDCLVRIKQFAIRRNEKHYRDLNVLYRIGYNGNYSGRILPVPPEDELLEAAQSPPMRAPLDGEVSFPVAVQSRVELSRFV